MEQACQCLLESVTLSHIFQHYVTESQGSNPFSFPCKGTQRYYEVTYAALELFHQRYER